MTAYVVLTLDEYEALRNAASNPNPAPASAGTSTPALAAAVAVMTARQQRLPVTVTQLTEDADLAAVARLLGVVACALLDKLSTDRGAGLLAELGAAAAQRHQP